MISRFLTMAALLSCAGSQAHAAPPVRGQVFSGRPLIPVQARAKKPDVWHSPQSSLDQFPRLGPEDCARYGRESGYTECANTRPSRGGKTGAVTSKTPPANTQTLAPAVAVTENGLEHMVGGLLLLRFAGRSPDDAEVAHAAEMLTSGKAAGVILGEANVESAGQLKTLTLFLSANQDPPPLILIDRPGGPGGALKPGPFKSFASPHEVGDQGGALEAFGVYQLMAGELAGLGVNMTIGPSAMACPETAGRSLSDCYGGTPVAAAAFSTAFTLAHQDRGVLAAMRYPATAARSEDAAVLRQMLKRQSPDALVLTFDGSDAATPKLADKTVATVRNAGFTGAILFDVSENEAPIAGSSAIEALQSGADLVVLQMAGEQSDPARSAIGAALDLGILNPSHIEEAAKKAAQLRATVKGWTAELSSGDPDITSSIQQDQSQ